MQGGNKRVEQVCFRASAASLIQKYNFIVLINKNSCMKIIKFILKRYLLTLLTLIVILYLTFFKPVGYIPEDKVVGLDKAAHFVMYFTLCAVFWFETFKLTLKPKPLLMAMLAVVIPIVFSGVMEYLQYLLTSYRTGDFDDFVFNTVGILVALVFSLCITKPSMVKYRNRRLHGK